MKIRILAAVSILLLLSIGQQLLSAETNNSAFADLTNLVARINVKLAHGQDTQADLADNLKEFDALLAKHKGGDPEALAQILVMKAKLYAQVLDEPEAAIESLQQIKRDFPTVNADGNIDDMIKGTRQMAERQKLQRSLVAGAPFPDFTEKDIAGKPLSVSGFKGKVLLVDFWATWCPPCLMELPYVIKTYEKYHDKGFEIIGISLDDDKDRLESFTRSRKMPWPQYNDGKRWENKLVQKYGVDAIPATFLLDREGKIIARNLEPDKLEAAVAAALAGK